MLKYAKKQSQIFTIVFYLFLIAFNLKSNSSVSLIFQQIPTYVFILIPEKYENFGLKPPLKADNVISFLSLISYIRADKDLPARPSLSSYKPEIPYAHKSP